MNQQGKDHSVALVRGIQRLPVNSPYKWPVTRKMFSFNDVIMGVDDKSHPIENYV